MEISQILILIIFPIFFFKCLEVRTIQTFRLLPTYIFQYRGKMGVSHWMMYAIRDAFKLPVYCQLLSFHTEAKWELLTRWLRYLECSHYFSFLCQPLVRVKFLDPVSLKLSLEESLRKAHFSRKSRLLGSAEAKLLKTKNSSVLDF